MYVVTNTLNIQLLFFRLKIGNRIYCKIVLLTNIVLCYLSCKGPLKLNYYLSDDQRKLGNPIKA